MWRTLQRSAVILVTGAALGLAANGLSPRRIPLLTPPPAQIAEEEFIPLTEAHDLWSRGSAFFLDARAPADYEAGHIPNAFNLPAEEFDEHYSQVAAFLTTNSSIVCYCDGLQCDLSHELQKMLRDRGYSNVHILKNGWTEWTKAGYVTTKGSQP